MLHSNKNGFSFISLLLTVLIIGILAHVMLSYYKKALPVTKNGQKPQSVQAVENARAAVKNLEQVSNQRADAFNDF